MVVAPEAQACSSARLQNLSTTQVDSGRLVEAVGDSDMPRFQCGIEPLRWKRERHRLVRKGRLQGFETSRAYKRSGENKGLGQSGPCGFSVSMATRTTLRTTSG